MGGHFDLDFGKNAKKLSFFQIKKDSEVVWPRELVRCKALVFAYLLDTLHSFPRPLEYFLGHFEVKTSWKKWRTLTLREVILTLILQKNAKKPSFFQIKTNF